MIYIFDNKEMVFIQSNSVGNNSSSFLIDSDDANVKKVSVNGSDAQIIKSKNGENTLRWVSRGLDFRLTAKLSEEELVKIALSIK